MRQEEAAAEAARRNRDFRSRGEAVGSFTPVERAPGEWEVGFSGEGPSWFSRLVQRLLEALPR